MKFSFIKENIHNFRVTKMCRILKVSLSGYYAWSTRDLSPNKLYNEQLLTHIKVIHSKSKGTYGSPRITSVLHDMGLNCGRGRVAGIMRRNSIRAKIKRKFKPVTTDSKHILPIAPNILNQNFQAERPNSVWLSDITYIRTGEGWLYLAAIMDVYNREIVGWAMQERMSKELTLRALEQAIGRRKPSPGLIHHSDRGSQYASDEYRGLLDQHKFVRSMSRKGNCYDNACMESFIHTLKTESVYLEEYETREEAKRKIFEYIEIFYNRVRKHSALGYKSPVEFKREANGT